MLASKNTELEDTVVTMHELSGDEKIRLQCMARERYEWDLASDSTLRQELYQKYNI